MEVRVVLPEVEEPVLEIGLGGDLTQGVVVAGVGPPVITMAMALGVPERYDDGPADFPPAARRARGA